MLKRGVLVMCSIGFLLTACGGGGGGKAAASTSSSSTNSSTTSSASGSTASDGKLPKFSTEFDRVCTTQVGFPGVKAYEKVAGVHPVALFEDSSNGGFVSSSRTLPDGWTVVEDSNFDDNSELAAVELVACSHRVQETSTGKQCEFDDHGTKVNLELVNATYELTVYSASSGEEVGKETLATTDTECPFIAVFNKGDTKYFNEPSDDDYTNALKPHVTP